MDFFTSPEDLLEFENDPDVSKSLDAGKDPSPWECVLADVIGTSTARSLGAQCRDCSGLSSSRAGNTAELSFEGAGDIPHEELQLAIEKRATPDKDPLDLSDDRTDSGIFEKDSDSEDLDLENSQPDHDEDDLEDEGFGRMDGQDNRTDKAKNKKKRSSRESSRQGHKGDSQPGLVRLSGGLSWDSGDKEK
eukprot:gene26085-11791_t